MNSTDVTIFLALCFFTLGVLGIIGTMSFYLNYYFKGKVYRLHLAYILATISFVTAVFIIHSKLFSQDAFVYRFFSLTYDGWQMLIFLLHTSFIYAAMLTEDKKFIKIKKLMVFYAIYASAYIVYSIIFSMLAEQGERQNVYIFVTSRLFIIGFSLVVFYYLIVNLKNGYFRYLFGASALFLLFGCLSLWDATANKDNSLFKGFQYICFGYVLENICFGAGFVYRIIKAYKENKSAELNYENQLGFVQLESQQETMRKIGEEIHDNVGQKLTLASLYTQQLSFENKAPQVNEKIENVGNIINESLAELRLLSKSLTDDKISKNSIVVLLRKECEKLSGILNCNVSFKAAENADFLSYQVKTIVLRIVQEFIQNSIKHSRCKNININVELEQDVVKLHLKDDGNGFDIALMDGKGIGLRNMKSRVELTSGKFELRTRVGKGTEIEIIIPT